jgi:hypothetical protein
MTTDEIKEELEPILLFQFFFKTMAKNENKQMLIDEFSIIISISFYFLLFPLLFIEGFIVCFTTYCCF